MTLTDFQEKLGYAFNQLHLLELAMTHRSFAFEHGNTHDDNQRLEFLGDAILDFVIADALYKQHPTFQEGALSRLRSRLVCETTLCMLARKLDFESHLRMGKGEISVSGMMRPSTLADAYESVIGAIYLDGGMEKATAFILKHHTDLLNDPDGDWLPTDAKTRLQEIAQSKRLELRYDVVGESGPSHAPTFTVSVTVDQHVIGTGTGKSKKDAQQAAAKAALEHWHWQNS